MAFLEVIGELFGFSDKKGWTLISQDFDSDLEFKGTFISENMSETVGSVLAENSTVNKEKPNQQWVGGESEIFTFQTRLFATNSFKNIKQDVETLKSLTRRDPKLRRAPIFLFTAGTEIGFTCFVKGVQFLYDELRSDGAIRGAVINITLQKIDEIIVENAATSLAAQIKFAAGVITGAIGIGAQLGRVVNIPGGSLHTIDRTHKVIAGDTFESIAKLEYGQALLGDVLRRVQPEFGNLKPGDDIQLVESTEIGQIQITQQSVPLKNTEDNLALREEFLELRNRKTTIFV